MNESSLLVWMMRLKQTEELIERRKEDLQGHQQRRCSLQAELQHEMGLSDSAVQELAGLREQVEALTRHRVQLQQDIAAARASAHAARHTARPAAQKQLLQLQLERLRTAVDNERKVQQQYRSSVQLYMDERGHRTQELRDRAEQISTRLQRLDQQESKLCLPAITCKLQQQQDQLQAKLHQLTATLTDSKQANACMRARAEAAAADTSTQLKAAMERLADVKRQAFQLNRQAAVNETRAQQLRQEIVRNKQQCAELEALTSRAAAIMDQLASNCDF